MHTCIHAYKHIQTHTNTYKHIQTHTNTYTYTHRAYDDAVATGVDQAWQKRDGQREKGGRAPKRGRHSAMFLPTECISSVQGQPDGLTIHTKQWFLGAGFLESPPIYLVRPVFKRSI